MKLRYYITFFLINFQVLYGWGKTGHRIVGKVGETYLTKNAKTQIRKLVGHHDLSRLSNWADEIKSDSNWDHAWDWHYCTIPDNEEYSQGKHKGLAVEKVNEFIKTLKNRKAPKEERIIALKFLVHLIGDLHQPLHVGNGLDKGGNTIKLKWFGENTNLHSIWDTKLIELQKLSYTEYSNYLLLNIDYAKIREWQSHNVQDYILESKELRTQCYNFKSDNLKWDYFYKHKSLLEMRLLQAGVRLSGELNRIFK
ncbi:MAG: S1/P1 nuclease [Candidatus Neomarinimicrobiota bacterium]|tara:strand:+ start:3591 stop:4349 length:759 start_codon:yes stop_codon:yes gene_type:complete